MQALQVAKDSRSKKVNKIEDVKALKSPMEAFAKLEEYAQNGYDSIPAEDKSYFLKCFGIFDRPATPKQFMLRVRIAGGQLSFEQAMVLGELARKFGDDYIDLTTRMQVELRYLRIEDIPTILSELKSVGISTYQTGVDNFRNILIDPLEGMSADSVIDATPIMRRLQECFLEKPEWISVLPRKFNTSISGSMANRSNIFSQDCAFVLANKNGEWGFNLYLGGKVGKIAKSADIFLRNSDEVELAFKAIITLFRDYGFRDNRNKNRLYFLLESVGIEKFSQAIRTSAQKDFLTAGINMVQVEPYENQLGRISLKDENFAVHMVVPSGIFSGTALMDAARACNVYGSGALSISVEQNIFMLGIKNSIVEPLLKEKIFERFKNINTPYFNNVIACAGTEHCPFGVIPNKPDAIEMADYLSKKVELPNDARVRMYWSACVKGCGINGLGDLGFEGCKAKVDGKSEYGVNISIGGKLLGESEEGHSLLKSVPLIYAKYYVEELMVVYATMREVNESFEKFYERVLQFYSRASLAFFMRINAYLKHNDMKRYVLELNEKPHTLGYEKFEVFEFGRKLYKNIIGTEAYISYQDFAPLGNQKPANLTSIEKNLNENIAQIVYKMIHPDADKRAAVFSELVEEIPYI